MAWNKILQESTSITQEEVLVLIKYGCLSSLQFNDRWGVQPTSALGAYSQREVTQVAAKHMLAYLGMQGLSDCLGLPSEGCEEEIHLLTSKQLVSSAVESFFFCADSPQKQIKRERFEQRLQRSAKQWDHLQRIEQITRRCCRCCSRSQKQLFKKTHHLHCKTYARADESNKLGYVSLFLPCVTLPGIQNRWCHLEKEIEPVLPCCQDYMAEPKNRYCIWAYCLPLLIPFVLSDLNELCAWIPECLLSQ